MALSRGILTSAGMIAFQSARSVIPIGIGIDISKLPKGSYRLEIQATDSAGQSTPWKTANFMVE